MTCVPAQSISSSVVLTFGGVITQLYMHAHTHLYAGCDVSIMIKSTPSTQNIPGLASTEYRVASGPFNFTCQVQGTTTGPLTYQWTSTCPGCPFATATDASVKLTALHPNDNGTHTCIVFDNGTRQIECGNASIEMKIVGML